MSIEDRATAQAELIINAAGSHLKYYTPPNQDRIVKAVESALREERRLVLEEVISIIPRETEDVEAADFKRGWQRSGTQFLKTIRKLMEG